MLEVGKTLLTGCFELGQHILKIGIARIGAFIHGGRILHKVRLRLGFIRLSGCFFIAALCRAAILSVISELSALSLRSFLLGEGFFDGKRYFSVFSHAEDLDLYGLSLGKVVLYLADIGIGHLGDMYHSGGSLFKLDKCAEFCYACDFSFIDASDF